MMGFWACRVEIEKLTSKKKRKREREREREEEGEREKRRHRERERANCFICINNELVELRAFCERGRKKRLKRIYSLKS